MGFEGSKGKPPRLLKAETNIRNALLGDVPMASHVSTKRLFSASVTFVESGALIVAEAIVCSPLSFKLLFKLRAFIDFHCMLFKEKSQASTQDEKKAPYRGLLRNAHSIPGEQSAACREATHFKDYPLAFVAVQASLARVFHFAFTGNDATHAIGGLARLRERGLHLVRTVGIDD